MKELIDEIMRRVPVQLKVGKVSSFNKNKGLTDITLDDGPDRPEVRIRAVADDKTTGIIVTPKKGSYVLVAMIDNKPESSYIVGYSEIDEYYINIPQAEMKMDKNGFLMKKGSNVMGSLMGDLLDAIMQLTVTTGTGPSGTPINMASFQDIKMKFSQLLKTS